MKLSTQHQAFRDEIRAFIRSNLPDDIRERVINDLYLRKSDHVRWQKILNDNGCFARSLPKEHGGTGWDLIQRYLFERENGLAGAPWIIPYGISMVAPVLIKFGSQEQIDRYMPGILSSDTWWCQGYSEPNSGSDLASLSCKAVREGDNYVINGTKMWTTQAHYADMMHALVRTDDTGPKQQGITFVVIDMKTPGITISPITTIDGLHHTNQVFFDDVVVPIENRVGEEGVGWTIAKFLLSHERAAATEIGWKLRSLKLIKQQIDGRVELGLDQASELLYRSRWAQLKTEVSVLEALEQDLISKWYAGDDSQHEAGMLKVRATEIEQELARLAMELREPYGTVLDTGIREDDYLHGEPLPWHYAAGASYQYLRARAATVYAGSNEIQRGIIASTMLK